MAKDKKANSTPDGRHLLAVGLPVGIVLGVLIVGAVLQSGPAPEMAAPVALNEDPPLPPPSAYEANQWSDSALAENRLEPEHEAKPVETQPATPARHERTAPPRSTDALAGLAQRVMEDVDRLGSTGDDWTAQIGVYCDDQRVSELVDRHGDSPSLFVLPVLLDDRACFRICWGHYTSHDHAARARDLPAALRGDNPLPRRISTVTEE